MGGGSSAPKRRLKARRSSSLSCWPRNSRTEWRFHACSIWAKSAALNARRSTWPISAPTAGEIGVTVTDMFTSAYSPSLSFYLQVGGVHHLTPFFHLALDAGAELLRRIEHRVKADLLQPLADFRQRADPRHLAVELGDDRGRRIGGQHEAGERIGLLPGDARFGDGRHVGDGRRALHRLDREPAQLALVDETDGWRQRGKSDRRLAGEDAVDGEPGGGERPPHQG